jgi:branched-chain amino acid transport system ATP-binding protein
LLIIDHLTKSFGNLVAVNDVSLTVEEGEIVGLIGPNGSGKTTLFEVVSGFYQPTKGKVLFNGLRIDRLSPYEIAHRGLARSFQLEEHFRSFSVYDTILLAALQYLSPAAARSKAEEVLQLLRLTDKVGHLMVNLPLADKKAVELGRIMAMSPRLALLDEIMAGLTSVEADAMADVIRMQHSNGTTFFLIEHRLEMVRALCHRIVVLNFGTRLAEGVPQEVLKDRSVIEAYVGHE